jgi:hypothetical protein
LPATERDKVPGHIFNRILVLGRDCRPRFHIENMPEFSRYGSLRISRRVFPKSVFSWQITPAAALLEYFRNDFAGMFELADIEQRGKAIVNVRFGTRHPHEFPPNSPTSIRDGYRRARARHDHLCRATKAAVADPLPTLFVFGEKLPEAIRDEIAAEIKRRRHGAPFILAEWRQPEAPPTDPAAAWQGDHEFWRGKLAAVRLEDPASLPQRLVQAGMGQLSRARKNLLRPPLEPYDG